MKLSSNKSVCFFAILCVSLTSGSLFAKDKTVGQKIDKAVDKVEEKADSAKKKAEELAKNTKEAAKKAHDKAKEKAHDTIDHL